MTRKAETAARGKARRLPPDPAGARQRFRRGFYARMRVEAAKGGFKYRPGNPDTASPRKAAEAIRRAVASDTPSQIINDIEADVWMMVLCAGNPISLDAPLDAQFLSAFQRIADWHAERTLLTPEELARADALIRGYRALNSDLQRFEDWRKGGDGR